MMKWPEIAYIEAENGMLEPVLNWPKQPEGNIGKYGSLRLEYMKNHRRVLCSQMDWSEEIVIQELIYR